MDCIECGATMSPEDAVCPSCAAPVAAAGDEEAIAQLDGSADPPTELLPAVPATAVAAANEEAPGRPDRGVLAPPLDPSVAVATPVPDAQPAAAAPVPRRLSGYGQLVAGVLIGIVGAAAGAAAVGAFGDGGPLSGLFASRAGAPPAADASPSPTGSAQPAAPIAGFTCEPQSLTAPGSGRWLLHRAEYGSRSGSDYLRLKLRRSGDDEGAAALSVERMPAGEVRARYGVDPPAGPQTALVVAFQGPVRIAGAFGGSPGSRALKAFRVERTGDGTVVAVLAVADDACYSLAGGDWQAGEDSGEADITLDIASR